MAISQLPDFMQAISKLESGHDYTAVGPYTGSTYGRALGRYQIMETIWPGWAREAGIPGADWRDPTAQDRVARHKMSQYYERYGSWDLVAIAWFAGPGRANTAQKHGIDAVGGIKDVLGTDVRTYVRTALGGMRGSTSAPSGQRGGRLIEGTDAPNIYARPDPVTNVVSNDAGYGRYEDTDDGTLRERRTLVEQQVDSIRDFTMEDDFTKQDDDEDEED